MESGEETRREAEAAEGAGEWETEFQDRTELRTGDDSMTSLILGLDFSLGHRSHHLLFNLNSNSNSQPLTLDFGPALST